MRRQVLATRPILARILRRVDRFRQVEGNEVNEVRFLNFSEEGWIEVAAKLCQKVHDAREVTLLIIRFVFPFKSGIEIKNWGYPIITSQLNTNAIRGGRELNSTASTAKLWARRQETHSEIHHSNELRSWSLLR